jgi:putative ABC transport system permease protein
MTAVETTRMHLASAVSMGTLRSIRGDLRHAMRALVKERAFTLVCVVSLGIGMGAVVALATLGRAITAPARGVDTDGLAEVLVLPQGPLREKAGVWALERWSYPDYQALRDTDVGMDITGWSLESSEFGEPVPDQKAPLRVPTLYVSPNYFRTFGVSLARGPGFDAAHDDSPSAEPRVILSHDFWTGRVGSDPDIVGKSVMVDGVPHTVVGITPQDFRGHFHFFQAPPSLLLVPLERHPRLRQEPNLRNDRTAEWIRIHGRLAPGVSLTQANGLVSSAVATLASRYPATNQFKAATVEPYASLGAAGRPESLRVFSVLLSLAGAVLLIVCVNISGMMLIRGATRAHELSIRAALGAGRQSLAQHLFVEALVLACAAGMLSGLVLFGIPALIGWWMGVPVPAEVDFDAAGALVAAGLCLLVSVLFGLLPAIRFSRPSLLPALQENAGRGGTQRIRAHRVAAMVQIGIAVPFLVVSGVMIDRVRTADYGLALDGLAGARIPASARQRDGGSIRSAVDGLRQAAGVRSVAIADGMPIDFDYREFRVARADQAAFATAHVTHVGEHFLETIGARLLHGRTITAEDRLMDAAVTVISHPLAEQLFPDADAIGQRLTVSLEEGRDRDFTVIGVTGDFASSQLTTTRLQLLVPLPDVSTPAEHVAPTVHLIVRGEPGDEPRLKSALETALRGLGVEALPGVAFPGIVTGPELDEKSKADLVAEGTAVGVAGGLVLVVAALGILGVVGFMVATRTREFAVRMALGSTRRRVFGLMLSDTIKLVIPGVAGGLLLAAVLIRTMQDVMGTPLTLGAEPLGVMEPVIYAGASVLAVTVALLAGLPAARRATSIDPMTAIRSE